MNQNNRSGYLTCILLVTSILAACTSTNSRPSDAFLAPISDQALDIVGDVHFGVQLADSVHLNHYFDSDTPNTDAFIVHYEDLYSAMFAISHFSADLVDLADAAEGDDALEPFIGLISKLDSEIRAISSAQAHLDDLNADPILANMRNAEHIIDAIRKAQPLITEYADIVTEILADTDYALADSVLEIYEIVGSNHSPMLSYREKLTARQNSTLDLLHIMDKVWSGDSDAWAELLAGDWALAEEIGKDARLSAENAELAEQYLIDRLEVVATIRRQLEPAFVSYQNELQELYEIEEGLEAALRLAYLIIENWETAQRHLARGEKSAFRTFASSLGVILARSAASSVGRK